MSSERADWWVCEECGALIGDAPTHDRWHDKQRGEPATAQPPTAATQWLTQQEAGRILGVTDRTIRSYIRTGALTAHKVQGSNRVHLDRAEIDARLHG